jgi:uncharacterized protein YndB with AHSA1/START domain
MVEETLRIRLAVPIERVFAMVGDAQNEPRWREEMTVGRRRARIETVESDGEGPGLGATYARHVRVGKERITIPFDITEWDPPRRVAFRDRSGEADLVRIELEAAPDGTLVTYTQRQPWSMGAGPLRRLVGWSVRDPMGDDLKRLAGALSAKPGALERVDNPEVPGPPFVDVIDAAAPQDAVFTFLADPRTQPVWRYMQENLVVEADWEAPVAGARFRTTSPEANRYLEWEIVELSAPRRVRFRTLNDELGQDIRFTLEPIAAGTRIRYELGYSPGSNAKSMLVRAIGSGLSAAMDGELRRIAVAVRDGAGSGTTH